MAKAAIVLLLIVGAFGTVWALVADVSPGLLSNIIQLVGTIVTGAGLLVAWNKAANRLPAYRQAFVDAAAALRRLVTGQNPVVNVDAPVAKAFTVALVPTVLVQTEYQSIANKPISEQIQALVNETNAIREIAARTDREITKVANAPKLTQEQVDSAVADALNNFGSNLEIHAVKDLAVALTGVGITAAGILVGIFG